MSMLHSSAGSSHSIRGGELMVRYGRIALLSVLRYCQNNCGAFGLTTFNR